MNTPVKNITASSTSAKGKNYWRSLDEVAQTKSFQEHLHREFPAQASEWLDNVSRRGFLKLMSASFALAGATACTRQPMSQIVPYVQQPENLVPGLPLFFATAMPRDGFATGVLVESHEGHPTKIEGNPEHPASRGSSGIFEQASILDLYDPDRSQAVLQGGEFSTWNAFLAAVNTILAAASANQGAGLRVLTETVTSPTLAAQINAFRAKFPRAQWGQFQPVSRDAIREGSRQAFGEVVETHYRFDKARVIFSLDADFLFTHPERLRYTREFAEGRRLSHGAREMNRLYVAESTPTMTGTMADHRWPVARHEIAAIAHELRGLVDPNSSSSTLASKPWLRAVAEDMKANRGQSLIIAGENQPAEIHALAHRLNEALGNAGKTVIYTASAEAEPVNQLDSLQRLIRDMAAGQVDALFILGGNPAFTAPADFSFGAAMERVKTCIHLGLEFNETATHAQWHIPQTHFLENWSDARSFDGTVSIIQPLILPLYANRSAHELMAALVQQPVPENYEIVRAHWRAQKIWPDFEKGWRRAVHDGLIADTALPQKSVRLTEAALPVVHSQPNGALELTFQPDPCVWDGQFANNGWLQELPKPVTKLTWDNAALVSPALAEKRQLKNGDVVELRLGGRHLQAPVWIVPGQADNSVALHFGYGRTTVGHVGTGAGCNAFSLRASDTMGWAIGLEMVKTSQTYLLVSPQNHHLVEGRDILFTGTLSEYRAAPDFVGQAIAAEDAVTPKKEDTLLKPHEHDYNGNRWGMAIDLNTCVGCNACMMACQAENNIPVVGKEQVNKGRSMLWIRVDSYFHGPPANPVVNHMPVPCMHCENAPCELVCPVGATLHDHEGLNLMVYNRCVGTRYCSNNCPYKVRRFNFLQFSDEHTQSLRSLRNPNVTVRPRGVMEKCTYCIQRISAARIKAEEENRPIRDGEIVTACQQACPAQAIVFGNIGDSQSQVSRLKAQALDYKMLGDLNTRPRTSYAAKLRNPNPALPEPA